MGKVVLILPISRSHHESLHTTNFRRHLNMTNVTGKSSDFAIKLKADPGMADRKNVSLGGAKKPLRVKLDPCKRTADDKQVRLGGAKRPLKVKLNPSRSTADGKRVKIGGAKAPLKK
ncbi:MAG: hypothetical protein PVJ78_12415 [Gammaproteobacteria bacterium]